jgi:hypothetical protein
VFERIMTLETGKCPFVNLPEKNAGRWGQGLTTEKMTECVWVKPRILAGIEFLEWTGADHCDTRSSLAYGTTKTRAKSCRKPDSCSIRWDRGFEIFSFLKSNAGLQLLDPLLQCISILTQSRNRLHVSTLVASSLKIVDILPELLVQSTNAHPMLVLRDQL